MFANYIFNRGLIYIIYKEIIQPDNKEKQFLNRQKSCIDILHKKDIQMANR
jgi:hypothetical protein